MNLRTIPARALGLLRELQPLAVISIYPHAILLRKQVNGATVEYPIDPAALANVLSTDIRIDTGLLAPGVLYVAQQGDQRTIIAYREPRITTLWMEGSSDPLRVPLPGLLMARTDTGGRNPRYSLYAVADRPADWDAKLYAAPLPNVTQDGTCWGTVQAPGTLTNDLSADFSQFLGSEFGNHHTNGKSKAHKDIRKALIALDGADAYPMDDLVEVGKLSRLKGDR